MENTFATKTELLQPCDPPFSFFELVESIWEGAYHQPFHRLCTLMRKMNARSFLKEELLLNQELEDEKEMAEAQRNQPVDLKAIRLTFFCSLPESLKWDDAELLPENHLLGYTVIVKLKSPSQPQSFCTFMLEAVVRPPSVVFVPDQSDILIEPITNYYLHNTQQFHTTIGTQKLSRTFSIRGSFFTQQNQLTSICAHAALRIAINSSPILQAPKLTNKYINDILKIDKYDPRKGLNNEQIAHVVESLGFIVHSANFLQNTSIEYDHFLYPSLESCLPTILGLEHWDEKAQKLAGHVVTVLGHTTNSDRWEPEARRGYGSYPIKHYISSAEWCDHYIISDDNFGMYSTLPSGSIRNFIVPTKNPNQHVSMAMSIVPKCVILPGYYAEQLAMLRAYSLIDGVKLSPPNIWLDRMKGKKQNLVCRTLLQTKEKYLNHINNYVANFTVKQQNCFDSLPDYIWVSEVSLPNIFTGNKHKLGDVVICANSTPREHNHGESLALAWFPGFIQLGHQPNIEQWEIGKHVPLIRNTKSHLLEW